MKSSLIPHYSLGVPGVKRRTRYDIYMDTLETVRRKGVSAITRISYGANLPVDRAKKIVGFLANRGLVKEEEYGDTRGYRITARGGEFLEALRVVNSYLHEDYEEEE